MYTKEVRYMRILIMFDLPTETKFDKKEYINFRRSIVNDGYDMIQYSVYQRLCSNLDQVNKYLRRLEQYKPKAGSVRAITVTNKQYEDTLFLVGKKTKQEKYRNIENFTLF